MQKTILVTGATDGIGLETAKMLVEQGHKVLLHGRSHKKLQNLVNTLAVFPAGSSVESYVADLSRLEDVEKLASAVTNAHSNLDVLINNAGVYSSSQLMTEEGLDVRFVVNSIAPYLLTKRLLPLMSSTGRVVNLSSAAQFPVDLQALQGKSELSDGGAYAQSKLALTMWSRNMALTLGKQGPAIIAVNPRSMLGSKMVKQAYGVAGSDLRIGADILIRAALSEEFADASGQYFDNDIGAFSPPHPIALDPKKCEELVRVMDGLLAA